MLPPPSILLSCLLHIQGSQGKDYFSLCVHLAASTMGSAALLNACMRSSTWGRGKRLLCALCIGSWDDRHVVTSHRSLESPVPCWGHSMWLGKDKVGAVGKQQGCALATAGQGQGRACLGSDEVRVLGHAVEMGFVVMDNKLCRSVGGTHWLKNQLVYLICRITSREEIPGKSCVCLNAIGMVVGTLRKAYLVDSN